MHEYALNCTHKILRKCNAFKQEKGLRPSIYRGKLRYNAAAYILTAGRVGKEGTGSKWAESC